MPVSRITSQPLFGHASHAPTAATNVTLQRAACKRTVYTRDELLSVSPAVLSPSVANQLSALNINKLQLASMAERSSPLRSLEVGACRHRKRPRRGGVRKLNHRKNNIKVLSFNVQSVRGKAIDIHELIIDLDIDIALLSETWLYPSGDETFIAALTPPGYEFRSFPRSTSRGGGIGIVYRSELCPHISLRVLDYSSFEAVELKLSIHRTCISLVCLCRPPPSKCNKLSTSMFFSEFSELLHLFVNLKSDFSVVGDFNFHFDVPSDPHVRRLMTLLSDHNLAQLVNVSTHKHGHTLDGVVVRSVGSKLSLQSIKEYPGLSDHFPVVCNVSASKPRPRKRLVTSRNLRALPLEEFRTDIRTGLAAAGDSCAAGNPEVLVDQYNDVLQQALDRYAPSVTRFVRDRPSAPWLSEEIREARRNRRQAERRWRESRLTIHRQLFVQERSSVKSAIVLAKRQYCVERIDSSRSSKDLFYVYNELQGKTHSCPLPTNVPRCDLPQHFSDFFCEKIARIRVDLGACACDPPTFQEYSGPSLTHFTPVTEEEVKIIISKSPAKSCILDPVPTVVMKQCIDDIVPVITAVINASLRTGVFPSQFKRAVVTPLLKKTGLDPNELKNFRPVSNLPFISKILEKVVLNQLQQHLSQNSLLEDNQSAYRKGHSTETAVLSVMEGLLVKADERQVSLMALLDLSAAFDTLDHDILLKRLDLTFGVRGVVLAWFASYLKNRIQSVTIDGHLSTPQSLQYGVPQGSVLGPVLFTLYSQPLSDILTTHICDFHKYADDTELSKSATPNEFNAILQSVQECVSHTLQWMTSNKLKLNTDKTDVIPVGSTTTLSMINCQSATIGNCTILFQSSVRYLGVEIDRTLSMQKHIGKICQAAFLELRRISTLRPYLSESATARLVNACITSRIDYCNSLLAGLPDVQISRLQSVQNSAARLILRKKKRDHVTPLLKQLHWLPVSFRWQYKLAVFAYQHFEKSLPHYLSCTLHAYQPPRSLRSSCGKRLDPPRRNLKTMGERAFSFQAPKVWNALPLEVRSKQTLPQFKSALKTHLFKLAFSP